MTPMRTCSRGVPWILSSAISNRKSLMAPRNTVSSSMAHHHDLHPEDTGSGAAAQRFRLAWQPNRSRCAQPYSAQRPFGQLLGRTQLSRSLASAVNSQDSSVNGRSLSSTRWNSHYLVPKGNTSTTVTRRQYLPSRMQRLIGCSLKLTILLHCNSRVEPLQPRQILWSLGVMPTPSMTKGVCWTSMSRAIQFLLLRQHRGTTDIGRKGVLAFADLTALPATTNDPPNAMTSTAINQAILFRNYATSQTSSVTLADTATVIADAFNSGASLFANYYLGSLRIGTSQDFGLVNRHQNRHWLLDPNGSKFCDSR